MPISRCVICNEQFAYAEGTVDYVHTCTNTSQVRKRPNLNVSEWPYNGIDSFPWKKSISQEQNSTIIEETPIAYNDLKLNPQRRNPH